MSMTSDRPSVQRAVAPSLRIAPAPPRRRHKPWIVAGILLIAGCAFGVGQLYLRSTSLRPVLAVAHDVPAGHILQAGDLRVVDGAVDGGVTLVPETDEGSILGQPVAHDLVAGGLLTRADVVSASGLSAGQAVVAIASKPGQYPPALAAGARVAVIDTGSSGQLTGATAPPVMATVLAVDEQQGPAANGAIISLRLPAADAASVASTAAAGRVALAPAR